MIRHDTLNPKGIAPWHSQISTAFGSDGCCRSDHRGSWPPSAWLRSAQVLRTAVTLGLLACLEGLVEVSVAVGRIRAERHPRAAVLVRSPAAVS
jgi:hypothetical protein